MPLQMSYACSILAILSMSLAEFSVLELQRRLCGLQSMSRYIKVKYWTLGSTIVVWTMFSVFALAFQCDTTSPHVYQPERCADGVLRYPVTVVNAITDAALAFSFNPIILKLVAKTRMKIELMISFGARML